MLLEQQAGDQQQDARQDVGARDHRLAADRVEQAAEQDRAEEVAGRETRPQLPDRSLRKRAAMVARLRTRRTTHT
jgi:hypothetical protein